VPGSTSTTSGNGQSTFFLHVMAAVAQLERTMIAERVRVAKAALKTKGEYSGGPAPYGWTITGKPDDSDRRLMPVPEEQRVIEKMQETQGCWNELAGNP
jgi:DNA invertase Pin-like site-specific DNA recombinase